MYLQIKKIKQIEKPRGKDTQITHIWLYKDDWTYVKFVPHNEIVIEKLEGMKIDITIPELETLVKEHEIDKLLPVLPKEPNLFDDIQIPIYKR